MKKFLQYVPLPFIAFTFLMLASCGLTDASRITSVLEKCADVSHRAAKFNGHPSAQANFIATEFQKINVSPCPVDFRMAFQAHIFAWQQAASSFANNNIVTAIIEGVTSGITGDLRYIGAASQDAIVSTGQINSTYNELTQIAAKYGARIPRSVVGE